MNYISNQLNTWLNQPMSTECLTIVFSILTAILICIILFVIMKIIINERKAIKYRKEMKIGDIAEFGGMTGEISKIENDDVYVVTKIKKYDIYPKKL